MALRPLSLQSLAPALAAALLLAGCATSPGGPAGDDAQAAPAASEPAGGDAAAGEPAGAEPAADEGPAEEAAAEVRERAEEQAAPAAGGLGGENLYRLLVADLAGRQGNVEVALEGYLETARESRDPRIAERAARLALYAGRLDPALEAAERWVELAPESRDAHAVLARMHLRDDAPSAALDHLRRVIALTDGGRAAGMREVAALLDDTDHPGPALQAMQVLVEEYPSQAIGHYTLARLALRTDATERALRHADRAIELDPDLTQARILRARIGIDQGEADAALDRLADEIEQRPDDRGLTVGYVRLLVEAGRDERAVPAMQRAFERFGDDGDAVYTLALLAMQVEAYNDARIYLERLVAMDQRASSAHYYLGRIAQQREEWTAALRHYIKVGRGEHRFDAELRAAISMAEAGRVDEARVHLERLAGRYDRTAAAIQVARTRARVERIAGAPDRALQVLGDTVEQYPDDLDLRYMRALMAAELDRFELARQDLEHVLEAEPDDPRALNALGYMLADRGLELQRARSMIERALEQNPEDAATLDSMGWVLYRLGRNREALDYLRRAWERSRDAEIAAHLGEVLWVVGERGRAREIWSAGEAIAPDNAVLRETLERLAP